MSDVIRELLNARPPKTPEWALRRSALIAKLKKQGEKLASSMFEEERILGEKLLAALKQEK